MEYRTDTQGRCYQNVVFWALEHGDNNMLIVHGLVTDKNGKEIHHAWIENGDEVIDPTNSAHVSLKDFYERLNAKADAKYPAMKAVGTAMRRKDYGPWHIAALNEEKEKIDPKQLAVGTEVEKEHTKNDKEAEKIATVHLKEKGDYYSRLNKAGLIDEPKAKKLVKKYLLKDKQLETLRENVLNEAQSEFVKGDVIMLLAPVEGYLVPPRTQGTVAHVDAVGTVRTEFVVNGKKILVPLNPEVDKIVKVTPQNEY